MANNLELTACCGIYCPDCIHYQNKHSKLARELHNELEKNDFAKYAAIKSPFGEDLSEYPAFLKILNALINSYCEHPCRVQGGCFSGPCKIMACCEAKGYTGCWECNDVEDCGKFDFLEPRCGNMPKYNIKKIKELGTGNWVKSRHKYYIWQ